MDQDFYADATLYELMFPDNPAATAFYRAQAAEQGGSVLELGCGTGRKLIPIASDGLACVGLDLSPQMLAEARRKATALGVAVSWEAGDMREFDLGRTFDFVFVAANSLLHLHEADSLLSCLGSVRRHLAPGGRFALDVFNPSVRLLSAADGVRRTREALCFEDPRRGPVRVDVAERYDAAAQVTRGTWYLSDRAGRDFVTAPLALRSIFPRELPLLLELAGLRLVERFGDWNLAPFTGESPMQLCLCAAS